MTAVIRLLNVNAGEFEQFYEHIRLSSHRMTRDQMLLVADLFHEKIRERRGQEPPLSASLPPNPPGRRQAPSA